LVAHHEELAHGRLGDEALGRVQRGRTGAARIGAQENARRVGASTTRSCSARNAGRLAGRGTIAPVGVLIRRLRQRHGAARHRVGPAAGAQEDREERFRLGDP
jgi:hypothetical protein